jgi:hypothetical protein
MVRDLNTGTVHFEWDIKNNLNVPMEISPYIQLYGCDLNRTGATAPFVFAAEQNCTTCGSSARTLLLDGTRHNAAGIRLDFIGSTLNIPLTSSAETNASSTSVVGKSVRNKYLQAHGRTNLTTSNISTTNTTALNASVCKQSSSLGTVKGKTLLLQPGESITLNSTMSSSDWTGGECSPVNHGLININVSAGGDSFKVYKSDQMIVFGKEESDVCSSS